MTSCVSFDDSAAGQREWEPAPEITPEKGPEPELPEMPGEPGDARGQTSKPRQSIPPPEGCTDHDPAVIATCLDTLAAVVAFPGTRPSALAAERDTGRIMLAVAKSKPVQFAKLKVSTGGDGGLTGLALSPTYHEDQLVFAYVTTATDNRVVRFTKGQAPKAVLTGIPKGRTGNRGAIAMDGKGALLVATGDAGNPRKAADPSSLAGKVLRINGSGKAPSDNPEPGSRVIAKGLHTPGGICSAADGSRAWVTDRSPSGDAVFRVEPGKPLGAAVWTWRDRPGVAGCAESSGMLSIATSTAGDLRSLTIGPDGSVTSKPQISFDGKNGYGRLGGMDLISDQVAVVGTVNKDGGKPVSSDDRVVLMPLEPSAGGGKD